MEFSFTADCIARIDVFLTKKFEKEYSRIEIQNFIKNKQVKLNNIIINKPSIKIKKNDAIVINCIKKEKEISIQPKEMKIDVVFENENLLIINKPVGLVVHPGAGNINNTLVNGLIAMEKKGISNFSTERGIDRTGIVHRLDKDTSGLMIIAKHNKAHRLLSELIKLHEIDRRYLALVHNKIMPISGKIEQYMCRDKKNIKKMMICEKNIIGSKISITNYKTLKLLNNSKYSIIECRLETGRTHQIRLHMFYIKHPLVGEQLYTTRNLILQDKNNGFNHQMLHSYKLNFYDPVNGEKIEVCNISKEFSKLLDE